MRLLIASALLASCFLVALPHRLHADGRVFVWRNQQADIYQPSQGAVIFWDGRKERLLLQTKYQGPAENLVWIVPLPSKPSVKKGSPRIFEHYSQRTQEPDIAYTRFDYGVISFGGGSAKVLEWQRKIGAFDVALLAPEDRDSVVRWLRRNEYGVDDRAVPILRSYVDRKWWIVASRIHRDALGNKMRERLAKGTLHPLEFTFETDACVYPQNLPSCHRAWHTGGVVRTLSVELDPKAKQRRSGPPARVMAKGRA